jgi:hypothetical protein
MWFISHDWGDPPGAGRKKLIRGQLGPARFWHHKRSVEREQVE